MKQKSTLIKFVVATGFGLCAWALVNSFDVTRAAGADSTDANATVVSVQVGQLKRMTLHRYVTGYGSVGPAPASADEPAADAPLAAPVAGVVARVNVFAGQQVKEGEVLMELNSGATTFALAKQELERQKKLYDQHNASLKALQDARAQLDSLRVTAPLSGTVTRLKVKPGQAVDASTVVAEVMDLKRLVVSAEIPAAEADQMKVGEAVQVLTDPPVDAKLSFVSPTVDASNDTVRIRGGLPADSHLRPGQFVSLRVVTGVHTNCLTAPEESVVTDINGQSVISLVHGDEATQAHVQTDFRENGRVEVIGTGLTADDSVVTVGAYGLPAKTRIQIVNAPAEQSSATNSGAAQ